MKKQKSVTLTQKELKKLLNQAKTEAVNQSAVMFIASLMEEYQFDDEKVCETFDDIQRWVAEINKPDHLITYNRIIDIINTTTGAELSYKAPQKEEKIVTAAAMLDDLSVILDQLYPGKDIDIKFANGTWQKGALWEILRQNAAGKPHR